MLDSRSTKYHILTTLILGMFLQLQVAHATESNKPESTKTSRTLKDGLETILIRGGTFTMGTKIKKTKDPEYHADETPLEVTIKTFRIGKFPITAEQMCLFLNSDEARKYKQEELYLHKDMIGVGTGKRLKYSTITFVDGQYVPRQGAAQAPANLVTWKGAVLFCRWLSNETGKKYRLPSEAEWEFTARGKLGRKYPWGDKVKEPAAIRIGERFSYEQDRVPLWCTTPVGSHPDNATPEGVMDMCAYIIAEWCANKYIENPTAQQVTNTFVDMNDLTTHRVVRGYYHRLNSRELIPFPFKDRGYHLGCAWTRMHCHPIEAVRHAARHGFRVVEEVNDQDDKSTDKKQSS
jgi:formylglycine-generating enzyme required for sulfatase activity